MNIRKQTKHNHSKHGKRIFSMLLAFVIIVSFVPQKVSAVGSTPDSWAEDGRSNYYLWNQVVGKDSIPKDGKWHRMLLFFHYDTMDCQKHFLNGDANYNYLLDPKDKKKHKRSYYDNTKTIAGSDYAAYMDLNDGYFFTKDHCKAFFVKYMNYSAEDNSAVVTFRTSDSKGNPSKYIGLYGKTVTKNFNCRIRLTDIEKEAFPFRLVTSESTNWEVKVKPGEMIIWGEYTKDDSVVFTDCKDFPPKPTVIAIGNTNELFQSTNDVIGVRGASRGYGYDNYLKIKMYIGEPYSGTFVTQDLNVIPNENRTFADDTYIQPGVNVNVAEGGTLTVSGTLYNNGTINNSGNIVFNRDSTLAYFVSNPKKQKDYSRQITGGNFFCDGNSSLVVCEGAKIILPRGLFLQDNAVCQNSGAMIFDDGLVMEKNAEFYNRNIGAVMAGYVVLGPYQFLKDARPTITPKQKSTIQGDGGSIPIMGYRTFPSGSEQSDEAGISIQSEHQDKWFQIIGDGVRFYNEGLVVQSTYVFTNKGLNWCEGVPPIYAFGSNAHNDIIKAGNRVGVTVPDDCRTRGIIPKNKRKRQ